MRVEGPAGVGSWNVDEVMTWWAHFELEGEEFEERQEKRRQELEAKQGR